LTFYGDIKIYCHRNRENGRAAIISIYDARRVCVVHPTHLPHDWHNIGAEENDDIVSSNITPVCCCGRPPLLSHFGFFFLKRKNSFVFFISFRYHIIRPSFSLSLSYRYGIIIRRRLYQLKTYSSFSRHV
jgi:hypothetical protein